MYPIYPNTSPKTPPKKAASFTEPLKKTKTIEKSTIQIENEALSMYKQATSRECTPCNYQDALEELSKVKEALSRAITSSIESKQEGKLKHSLQMTEGSIAHIEGCLWYREKRENEKLRRKKWSKERTSLHKKAMENNRKAKQKEHAEEAPVLFINHR